MPKYKNFLVYGYYLYFTSHCVVEAFHVHASNKQLSEGGSAKFFVREDGTSTVTKKGRLSNRTLRLIQEFILENHEDMYKTWVENGGKPEYYNKC